MQMGPFCNLTNKDEVAALLKDDNLLILPICDDLILIFNKMINPSADCYLVVEQEHAPIVGLFHKQVRFFKYYVNAYKAKNVDISILLNRVIYEAYIKMLYLIDNPNDVKEYRALAFKPHLKILEDERFADTPILAVFKKKFDDAMKVENLSIEDIKNARKNPGGKNFRQMQEIYEPGLYDAIYSMTSDCIHSGWNEIRQMYLRCDEDNRLYFADIDYSQVPHFRMLLTMAEVLMTSSLYYYNWVSKNYPGVVPNVSRIILEIKRVCKLINDVVIDTYKNNPEEYLYK